MHGMFKPQQILIQHLDILCNSSMQPTTPEAFDTWHRTISIRLVARYREHGHEMFIGQAQKWINMSLKYIFTVGDERIPGFQAIYPFCHIPLDSILVRRFRPYGAPALPNRWSRIDDYEQYLKYQHWVRQRFTRLPLDIEFLLWMKQIPPE
jgi:hypothetical protein